MRVGEILQSPLSSVIFRVGVVVVGLREDDADPAQGLLRGGNPKAAVVPDDNFHAASGYFIIANRRIILVHRDWVETVGSARRYGKEGKEGAGLFGREIVVGFCKCLGLGGDGTSMAGWALERYNLFQTGMEETENYLNVILKKRANAVSNPYGSRSRLPSRSKNLDNLTRIPVTEEKSEDIPTVFRRRDSSKKNIQSRDTSVHSIVTSNEGTSKKTPSIE